MLRLLTFGGLALERVDGSPPPRVRPQRLAILAIIAAAGERGVSRERLCGLLWADADEARARHALRQALYALGNEVDVDLIETDPMLRLDRTLLSADVADFHAALSAKDLTGAANLATGSFLQGFYLPSAPNFERWVEEERASLHASATRVLLTLAKDATTAGTHDHAVEWWRRLTVAEPLSGRFALGYLKALAARGDRAGALAFARDHEAIVRRELEADADPEIRRLEADLRALPSPVVERHAPALPGGPGVAPASNERAAPPSHPEAPVQTSPAAPKQWTAIATAGVAVVLVATILAANLWGRVINRHERKQPTFAVGLIREDGVPDTLRIGGVLTDMLATNLARVAGLQVLATSRLFELMLPRKDTLAAGYLDAARRGGATEILQGRLLSGPQWGLAMELQRVDVASGMVKGAYRVAADDRYALVDSMTAAITRDLHLGVPSGSVADATTDSPIAYRLYEEGLRAYYSYDHTAARRLMQSALQEDSTFAMAAYYDALLVPSGQNQTPARTRALRLSTRAPERERLMITANLLSLNMEPAAIAVAESLTTRYPDDPRAYELLGEAYWFRGDWREASKNLERAIALDSASDPSGRQSCRLCGDFAKLSNTYLWWDSLQAAERTAWRYLRARPKDHGPWDILVRVAATRGDSALARQHYRRFYEVIDEVPSDYLVRLSLLLEDYDQAEKDAQQLLHSSRVSEVVEGSWFLWIALRNQGRLNEAMTVALQRKVHDPDRLLEALAALDQGDKRKHLAIFDSLARVIDSQWPPGIQARIVTWNKMKYAMALGAAGDTVKLRSLVDTVETWGQRSLFGRDRRAHHYVRGMLLVARGQDAEAADELRQAIHSPTNGFTRVNYELGRVLLRLNRPAEAVSVV